MLKAHREALPEADNVVHISYCRAYYSLIHCFGVGRPKAEHRFFTQDPERSERESVQWTLGLQLFGQLREDSKVLP